MTVAPEMIRITDDSTVDEIREAITHLGQYAARQMHHRDCVRWVKAHARIDALLTELERALLDAWNETRCGS